MKRLYSILAIVIVLCLLAGGAYYMMHQQDVSAHTNTLEIKMQLSCPAEPSAASISLHPGADISFTVEAENQSYSPAPIRQTVVVSLYDSTGNPLPLDGTTWTCATLDIFPAESDTTPCPGREIRGNQLFYTSEYALGPASIKYKLPFTPETDPGENTAVSGWRVGLESTAAPEYANCVAVMDVFLESAHADAPNQWQTVCHESIVLGSGDMPSQHTTPTLSDTTVACTSYQWEVRDGWAYLTGLGSVLEPDILIPGYVTLAPVDGQYCEVSRNGTAYPVIVAGDAFFDCDTLHTVSFQTGVQIENNRMSGAKGGMFENCDGLTVVNGIPDAVRAMSGTFAGCTSLRSAPGLPASLTDLSACFRNCIALTYVHHIPQNVEDMYETFSGCSSLLEIPPLPDKLSNLIGCFQNCTSLTQPPELPGSVTVLKRTFSGCSSLTEAPVIPDGVTDMTEAFSGCSSLLTAPALPDSIIYLQRCFKNCTSLSGIISLPVIPTFSYEPESIFRYESIEGMLDGCSRIEAIHILYCDGRMDPQSFSKTIPVVFTGDHQTGTVCPICHFANLTTEIDNVEVVIDNIPEKIYLQFVDYFDNKIPDWLKAYCSRMTFTDDLGQYDKKYISGYSGFARSPEGTAYVLFRQGAMDAWASFVGIPNTMVHELAHTYDHQYSSRGYESDSARWRAIHAEEGDTAASLYYDLKIYNENSASSQRRETFAMALEEYFMDPGNLKQNCPLMYEYIRDLVAAQQ